MNMNKILLALSSVALLFSVASCSKYDSGLDTSFPQHLYREAKNIYFYNSAEALSRAVRWELLKTVTDPEAREYYLNEFFPNSMAVKEEGNRLKFGALNYVSNGIPLMTPGAELTVTNDYLDDYFYSIKCVSEDTWNVSFRMSMDVADYDYPLYIEGESVVKLSSEDLNTFYFDIVSSKGRYMDKKPEGDESVGIIDVTAERMCYLTKYFFEQYGNVPFGSIYYSYSDMVHVFHGSFTVVCNTRPQTSLYNETYIFDLSYSDLYYANVYFGHNGIWGSF